MRLNQDPEPLQAHCPDLDPELAAIIMRSLARDRQQRWTSMSDMREAFARAFHRLGVPLHEPVRLLEGGAKVPLPLAPLGETVSLPRSTSGSMEVTAELPQTSSTKRGRRWWLAALVLPGLLGASWVWARWTRPVPSVADPSRPAGPTLTPSDAPTVTDPGGKDSDSGNPGPRDPGRQSAHSPTAQDPEPLRRAVVYPQLLEGEAIPLPLAGSGCAGQRVNVSLVVGEEGTVKRCKVLSVVPAACAEAARTHAMRYRFKPALDAEGRPVETTVAAAVDFLEAP